MRSKLTVVVLLLLASLLGAGGAWALSVEQVIPYQKQVLATPGSGSIWFTFSLWTDPTVGVGAKVWHEDKQIACTASTRAIATKLGDTTSFASASVDFSQQLYVQVSKTADGDLVALGGTRDKLNMAPYALWSATVPDGAITAAKLHGMSANNGQVLGYNNGWEPVNAGGTGTVTGVAFSGGTTGLSVTGSPITTSGTFTLAGTLAVANGGTGATTQADAATAILPAQSGNSGKYLTTDGSSASWGTVSGGGGGSSTVTATASGTLVAGQLVEFTSTGEVKSIVNTVSGTSDAISSFVVGQTVTGAGTSPQPQHIVSTFVGADKVVVAYSQSDGSYVAAGTLTGTTVTWGQPVKFTSNLYPTGICMLEVDRFAVTYSSAAAPTVVAGYLMVGKLTGAAITMGTPSALLHSNGYNFQCVGLGNNYIAFTGAMGYPELWKYDSTTLGLTYKTYTTIIGSNILYNITQYDTDKYLYATTYSSNLSYSFAMARTSDTSQTFSSGIETANASFVRVVKTSATNNPSVMLYVYWNGAGTTQYARTATITTGGTLAWQSAPVAFQSGYTFSSDNMTLVNTADNMAVLIGSINGSDIRAVSINTASGTPVIGTYSTLLSSGNARNINDYGGNGGGSNGRFITAYCDTIDANKPKVIVGQMGNSSTVDRANATGIVVSGASNGGTATIALLGGAAGVYSGLTPGAIYYIQSDGSIGTAVTPYPAGVAINSTTLQMYSTGAISNGSITVTQNGSNQIKSNTGNTAVYTEYSQGDESVRVYAAGKSSFYADGHSDSSLNVDRGMVFTAISIADLASGGVIGAAAATVDMGTMFNVAQTTAGQSITIPSPTNVKPGRTAYLCNTGSASFTTNGATMAAGRCQMFVWTGAAWSSELASGVHYIGENYGGGIVYYVYDGGRHGLIASAADHSAGRVRWYGGSFTNTRARADGIGAGLKNTAIIIANQGPVDGNLFAATLANEYTATVNGVTYGDWYLPSMAELALLLMQNTLLGNLNSSDYWSSTESDASNALFGYPGSSTVYTSSKQTSGGVRPIRAF